MPHLISFLHQFCNVHTTRLDLLHQFSACGPLIQAFLVVRVGFSAFLWLGDGGGVTDFVVLLVVVVCCALPIVSMPFWVEFEELS